MGQVQLTTHLLAGMLGIDGGAILGVLQSEGERLSGRFRVVVQSEQLPEVPQGMAPPIVELKDVQ